MHARRTLALALLYALSGCAARLPETPPARSAASLTLPRGHASPVGVALTEEPPLPGEPTVGWEGLETPSPAGGHHHAQ